MYAVKACGRERGAEIETEMNRKSIVVAFVLGIFFVVPPHRQYHFDTQPKSAYKRILKQINKSCIDRLMIFRFFFAQAFHKQPNSNERRKNIVLLTHKKRQRSINKKIVCTTHRTQ